MFDLTEMLDLVRIISDNSTKTSAEAESMELIVLRAFH